MKLLKKIICKTWKIFNLPKFSQTPKIKISKCKIPEIVPTNKFRKSMEKYFKNVNFNDTKIYVDGKKVNKEGD